MGGASGNGIELRCRDVTRTYADGRTTIRAIDGFSFRFRPGEMAAITGPSGSVKSTLLAAIDYADGGTIHAGETELGSLSTVEQAAFRAATVSYLSANHNLLSILTVYENISRAARAACSHPAGSDCRVAGCPESCYTAAKSMGSMTRVSPVVYTHTFGSPIGTLHAAVDRDGRVCCLGFGTPSRLPAGADVRENERACGQIESEVAEYFAGVRREFSLDLRLDGTDFQRAVWSGLMGIEYGQTATYGQIAQKIGRRDAARAVGNAVAVNPVALLVPCHRVVPAGGGTGNYALRGTDAETGRKMKRTLLDLESRYAAVTSSHTPA